MKKKIIYLFIWLLGFYFGMDYDSM